MKAAKIVATVKSSGGLRIDIRNYADGRYGFDWTPADGIRKKIRLDDKEAAVVRAQSYLEAGKAGRLDLLSVDPGEFAEFLRWKEQRKSNVPKVPALVESFIESKRGKGRSEWTVESLRKVLTPFAAAFDMPIDQVTREAVERWLDTRGIGERTWNNFLAGITSLARFARKEGHIGANLIAVEMIDRKFHRPNVETYSRDELVAILQAASEKWIPAIVLGAFAGIRPEEVAPDPRTTKPGLAWENILWTRGKIDVPAAVAKGTAGGKGRRRFVPINDALRDFLEPYTKPSGPIAPGNRLSHDKRYWTGSITWKQDGLRHSYASYRLAILKNMHELALEMGNSANMIHRHYLDLKHEDEGAEWFALRRSDVWVGEKKVIPFPA